MKLYLSAAIIVASISCSTFTAFAQDQHTSKYAGEENRVIKSLSADDIEELLRGGGWGLAKAAELNGVPGPAHLLEMKGEIPLSEEQILTIEEIYEGMKAKAIVLGEELIDLERKLNQHFESRTITDILLQSLLSDIAKTRSELRYIHLATHLKTPDILSENQILRYNELRGYLKNTSNNNDSEHNMDGMMHHSSN